MFTPGRSVLSEDLLERCAQRAAAYDRENRFFFEDFEELRETKYLLGAVPEEFGGLGLTLLELCREQRRLARRSAPNCTRRQHAFSGHGHCGRPVAERR